MGQDIQDKHQNDNEVETSNSNSSGKDPKNNFKDNSNSNQCLKILNWLYEKGSITTTEAREHLDIMSPAARILQLKQANHSITKINDTWTSEHGINHKGVARYVLSHKMPLKADENSGVTE